MHDAGVNVMGTLNVLILRALGARKVVYAASGGTIYGEPKRVPAKESAAQGSLPLSPYGISKKVVLDYLGVLPAVPRAGLHGARPRQRVRAAPGPHGEAGVIAIFAAKMLAGEAPTIYGDGNQTRDYVFVDDVVHAFVQAMERGSGKLVNIGTGWRPA